MTTLMPSRVTKWVVLGVSGLVITGATGAALLTEAKTRSAPRLTKPDADKPFLRAAAVPLGANSLPVSETRTAIEKYLAVPPRNVVDLLHQCRVVSSLPPGAGPDPLDDMMAPLLSDVAFAARFPQMPALYSHNAGRWHVLNRVIEPQTPFDRRQIHGEGHVDQVLACLAELRVPPARIIQTGQKTLTLADLVTSSQSSFVRDQEVYWSIVAYSLLSHEKEWRNRFGETDTFDSVARDLMTADPSLGSCAGGHRLYTLAVMLRRDSDGQKLSARVREQMTAYLRSCADHLSRSQLPNGAWNQDWAASEPSELARQGLLERFDHQVLVTGHHMEWMAIVPPELRCPDDVLVRAGRFLMMALQNQVTDGAAENFCAYSHAAGSLALLQPEAAPRRDFASRPIVTNPNAR